MSVAPLHFSTKDSIVEILEQKVDYYSACDNTDDREDTRVRVGLEKNEEMV